MTVRVVLAEDEAIIRRDLRETLELEGYDVVGDVGRGDEARDLIRALQPDVAILDIKMPGMDGLSVAADLNKDRVCAVIVLTAFSQRSLVDQAREAGVMAYLVKPFQASDLVPAIELARARFDERAMVDRELRRIADEHERVSLRLESRVLLDRAKAMLMETNHLSEPEAFRFLQKTAMDRRSRVGEIAQLVIDGSLSPPEVE
ncbi:MAG: ANTAR domain-containing response regulator [Ferrimicrobium sp.]